MATVEVPPQTEPAPADVPLARLKLYCRLAAVLLGALQAYASRHYMNADGISYLDIGDAYLRGDWQDAVNSYWGPLYSWLVGATLALVQPTSYWQFATVKAVNFVLYLGSLLAFDWLLRELLLYRHAHPTAAGEQRLPDWAFLLLGYGLFLCGALVLIWVGMVSPDMGVALCVYLLAALLTRGRRLGWRLTSSALLGLVLGTAYLVKAVMLPLGAVFLGVSALAAPGRRRALLHLAISGILWAVIAGSYVRTISAKVGRFAFGDASTLNYLWFANGVELFRWRSADASLGRLLHPPRQVFDAPPVFEFATPIAGTYPLWYDPPYWVAGLTPRFTPGRQVAILHDTTLSLLQIFFGGLAAFTVTTALLYFLGWSTFALPWRDRLRRAGRALASEYQLLLPALAAVGLYALVYVEARLVAPFLVLLLLGVLGAVRWAEAAEGMVARRLPVLVGLALVPVAAMLPVLGVQAVLEGLKGEGEAAHKDWAVATHLAAAGVLPGERVGVVGDAFECGWARVGGLRITAQVLEGTDENSYWRGARQADVLEAFRRAGVAAVVTSRDADPGPPWARLGDTQFYVVPLRAAGVP